MDRIKIIKKFYEEDLYNNNIPDHEKLHWESEWCQKIRFEMFLENVELGNKSLLDVGCGLGNLYEYIEDKELSVNYTGIDLLKHMVEEARKRYPGANFYNYDIFKNHPFKANSFDIVYASGIFNLNLGNNKKFLVKAIEVFLEMSKEYVAFNLLHKDSKNKEKKFYYFEPANVVKIIEKAYASIIKIEIIEHYLNNDFTVICKKC